MKIMIENLVENEKGFKLGNVTVPFAVEDVTKIPS